MDTYEKKYKEALERAKELSKTITGANYEHIFPELKESEDGKIRKALMQNLKERFGTKGNMGKGLDMPDVLDWFEKQCGQRLVWSEKDKNMLEWVIGYLENKILNTSISEERIACKKAVDWLKSLKDRVQPQPKQEWSDEDERVRIALFLFVEAYGAYSNYEVTQEEMLNWLESLKNRVQPKQEWDEKDEKHLNRAINVLNASKIYTTSPDKYEDTINWLKSLRPQNTWKPSDEQIKALETTLYTNMSRNDERYSVLSEFVAELKKLK